MLGLAAGASAIGSGVGAYKRNQGHKAQNAYYDYARDVARSEQYNSIFDSPAGKSLLKLQNASDRKALDAINNRAVAGGAPMENQLAARQSINENRDRITSQLLQYDDRNRRAWKEKDLALAGQQAQFNANTYYQAAQDWSQWGGQMANSLMSLGSAGLLGGMGGLGAGAASAMAAGVNPADVAGSGANVYNTAVAASRSPQINPGVIPAPSDAVLGDLTRHAKA